MSLSECDLMEGRKSIVYGITDFFVLSSIEDSPLHGYGIMRRVRKAVGVALGPSQVYPLLSRLEKKGLVKSEWDLNGQRPRKLYTLTRSGKVILQSQKELLECISRL